MKEIILVVLCGVAMLYFPYTLEKIRNNIFARGMRKYKCLSFTDSNEKDKYYLIYCVYELLCKIDKDCNGEYFNTDYSKAKLCVVDELKNKIKLNNMYFNKALSDNDCKSLSYDWVENITLDILKAKKFASNKQRDDKLFIIHAYYFVVNWKSENNLISAKEAIKKYQLV